MSTARTSAERWPVLQYRTTGLSCGSCGEGVADEELVLRDEHRAGDVDDLVLAGLADIDEQEVLLAAVRASSICLRSLTLIVESRAASAASWLIVPQNAS